MSRRPIPPTLKNKLFYDARFVCSVCQSKGLQIHHIDKDSSNNDESNLIVLCISHHNEAHTMRELTANLTPDRLRSFKAKWLAEVVENRKNFATSRSGRAGALGPMWGYLNHSRLVQTDLHTSESVAEIFETCRQLGLVDQHGIAITPVNHQSGEHYLLNTVYSRFDQTDAQRVHKFYSAITNEIVRSQDVIYLEKSWWTKPRIRANVSAGNIVFINSDFYFKKVREDIENEHRLAHKTNRKVKVEFGIDTRFMYGTTSMEISFAGHSQAAALLIVKSINELESGELVLKCTPLALGIGFEEFRPSGTSR